MAGFVTAAALVRPSKSILDLEARSVLKRMKDKAFARAVSRDDLRLGAEELGLPLGEHVANVIRFMREQAPALGLASPEAVLFVGDNPVTDIDGARAFGMRTAWVTRGRQFPAELHPPDIAIERVTDLRDLLGL